MFDNLIYWISVLLGFMIVLITYKYSSKFYETFVQLSTLDVALQDGSVVPSLPTSGGPSGGPSGGSSSGGSSSGAPSGSSFSGAPSSPTLPVVPIVNSLPRQNSLLLYFNSFNIESNIYIPQSNLNNTYVPTMNKWQDSINPQQYSFAFYGAVPPTIIKNIGLPMKNIKMAGPKSGELAPNDHILQSFSIVFYLTFTSLTFDSPTNSPDIVLFEIFAATPNYIRLSFAQIDNDKKNISVDIIIGTLIHSWVIPITTILSNGASTLYGIVYNNQASENQFTFHVGLNNSTVSYKSSYNNTEKIPTLYLTYEPVLINSNQNLDAFLSDILFL
jgi:hypothetical protein